MRESGKSQQLSASYAKILTERNKMLNSQEIHANDDGEMIGSDQDIEIYKS